jgi:aspartyl protease family protein
MNSRHSMGSALIGAMSGVLAGMLCCSAALAADVTVVGLFPNKAVVQIDGGAVQTLSVGQKTAQGVALVEVERDTATFEVQGRRVRIRMGQAHATSSASSAASVVLSADSRGHFITDGQINGLPIRFIVDTGASLVSIPSADARRLALDYRKGQVGMMNTANGPAPAYRIKLDTVQVGGVVVNGVDAVVMEGAGMPFALLGMSFLNRMQMKRDGDVMTLTRRY